MPLMNATGMNTADSPNAIAMTAGVTSSIAWYVASRGLQALLDPALDVLDDDDRVVDHDADRQHQPEQRQVVQREPEQPHDRERADQRHRDRQQRDDRRPPALQEHEHDDARRAAIASSSVLTTSLMLSRTKMRRVVRDRVLEPRRASRAAFSSSIFA